jgi:hypothetical protein
LKMDSLVGYRKLNYWYAAIAPSEVDSMWKIVHDNNLIGSADPVLPDSAVRCYAHAGSGGGLIIFQENMLIDTIRMNAAVKCPAFWSPGLRSLVAYKDSLVNKYNKK